MSELALKQQFMILQNGLSLTGGHSDIKILGKRRGWDKTIRRCACIEEISKQLGYVPQVTLDEGLPLTVAWLRDKWIRFKRTRRRTPWFDTSSLGVVMF